MRPTNHSSREVKNDKKHGFDITIEWDEYTDAIIDYPLHAAPYGLSRQFR